MFFQKIDSLLLLYFKVFFLILFQIQTMQNMTTIWRHFSSQLFLGDSRTTEVGQGPPPLRRLRRPRGRWPQRPQRCGIWRSMRNSRRTESSSSSTKIWESVTSYKLDRFIFWTYNWFNYVQHESSRRELNWEWTS